MQALCRAFHKQLSFQFNSLYMNVRMRDMFKHVPWWIVRLCARGQTHYAHLAQHSTQIPLVPSPCHPNNSTFGHQVADSWYYHDFSFRWHQYNHLIILLSTFSHSPRLYSLTSTEVYVLHPPSLTLSSHLFNSTAYIGLIFSSDRPPKRLVSLPLLTHLVYHPIVHHSLLFIPIIIIMHSLPIFVLCVSRFQLSTVSATASSLLSLFDPILRFTDGISLLLLLVSSPLSPPFHILVDLLIWNSYWTNCIRFNLISFNIQYIIITSVCIMVHFSWDLMQTATTSDVCRIWKFLWYSHWDQITFYLSCLIWISRFAYYRPISNHCF